jgi:hypothetical protein
MNFRKLTAGLVGLALLATTAADAATAIYKITKIDGTAHAVTLGNNQVYTFPNDFKLDDYKVGDLVRVTFTSDAGKNNATALAKQ